MAKFRKKIKKAKFKKKVGPVRVTVSKRGLDLSAKAGPVRVTAALTAPGL